MDGKIMVTPQQLRTAAGEFNASNTTVRNIATEMMNTVKSLNAVWTGEAATAYYGKMDGLSDDIERLSKLITEYSQDLEEMAAAYDQGEQEAASIANSLPSDIL
ncbi:MAG: WXG100 family type VII secretion target [Lachnospiraceae bacterium]|nr:WXG100 family type VII secretion target [Lachnospiraceae bacterium]